VARRDKRPLASWLEQSDLDVFAVLGEVALHCMVARRSGGDCEAVGDQRGSSLSAS
jgi:hypothetical protein